MEIQKYMNKFEEMNKQKQDNEIEGVTFKPEIFTKLKTPANESKGIVRTILQVLFETSDLF